MKDRPATPLKVVSTEITKNHPAAVYFEITFEDANGKLWTATGANFLYDLKPKEVAPNTIPGV